MLILTTMHLHNTLDHFFFIFLTFFYFIIIHLILVLVTWSLLLFVCGFKKINLLACEDKVKAN